MSDTLRRKLLFRAHHRGMKELDLFIGAFADQQLSDMSDADLAEFEAVLEIPDQHMLDWVMGRARPDDAILTPMLDRVLSFRYVAPEKK